MLFPLYLIILLIAFLYASVGFGGATGYLAAMSFFNISPKIMASTALILNIIVASISFTTFYRAGHLRRDLLAPFLVTSIPAAFIGGFLKITDQVYTLVLYAVLTLVTVRLLFFSTDQDENRPLHSLSTPVALAIGLVIGLISGMVGIGGGIFLSPVIVFTRWGTTKQAAAVAAAFIVLNSISGLFGRLGSGTFMLDSFSLTAMPLGVLGSLIGSYFGARYLSSLGLRRALGVVMAVAVSTFWTNFWR
jgi:hypothetical protein